MTIEAPEKRYTVEEYLTTEERSTEKHEFYDGRVMPTPSRTVAHNQIAANATAAVVLLVRQKIARYKVYNSAMKIYIEAYNSIVYPGVIVVCENPASYQGRKDVLTNPLLIVEILSRSTAQYDRTLKFEDYRTIPSFREYVLVNQDRAQVSVFYREAEDLWRTKDAIGLDASIPLQSLGGELALADVYEGVEFQEGE